MRARLRLLLVVSALAAARTAPAQQIAGTLVRAGTETPVAGAVVQAETVNGDSILARAISTVRGTFVMAVRAGEVRLRVLRIGFRPAEVGRFTLAAGELHRETYALTDEPLRLQVMSVRANSRCDAVGKASEEVATLFDEARKALIATQLSAIDSGRTAIAALSSRFTEVSGEAKGEPRYRLRSGPVVRPFVAVAPEQLAREGYVVEEEGSTIYRAPDAAALLSETFTAQHCLQLVDGKGDRSEWVGIGFRPERLPRQQVGISGTLWIDRASFELRVVEFAYEGLPAGLRRVDLGGEVHFARLDDGSWIEQSFELRMPRLAMSLRRGTIGPIPVLVAIEHSGGQVLSMRRGDSLIFTGDSALERRLLAALGASGGSLAGVTFGSIQGRLLDSLRVPGERGLPGDTVVLKEFGLRAETDFSGGFDFRGVPAGRYRLAFAAPWLDSVGLGVIEREVEVRAGEVEETQLSTPSLATYQALQCGALLDTLDAVLVGEVMDGEGAPLARATVRARWRTWRITGDSATQQLNERVDTTAAAGTYVLCGVPREARFTLEAQRAPADSAVIVGLEPLDAAIRRRNLVSGERKAIVRVRGTVVGPDRKPVARATVASPRSGAIAAVRGDGSFEVAVDGRISQQLIVRALGYQPQTIDIDPRLALLWVDDIMLQPVVAGLDTVRVVGRQDPLDWRPEFDYRRAIGLGAFVTEEQIKRMPRVTGNQIAMFARRMRVDQQRIKLVYGVGGCYPRWFVDGNDEGKEVDTVRRIVQPPGWAQGILDRAKSIEVYSAAEAPAKYNDFDGCGAIIVWTR